MPAPAHYQIGSLARVQDAGVSQYVENGIRDAGRGHQVELLAALDVVAHVHDVAQHREEILLDAPDHAPIHESAGGGVDDLELDAPLLLDQANIEIPVLLEDRPGIIGNTADVQHREGAAAEHFVQSAMTGIPQLIDLQAR